jgi:hypothetical protein
LTRLADAAVKSAVSCCISNSKSKNSK